jgi:hypothetical protein
VIACSLKQGLIVGNVEMLLYTGLVFLGRERRSVSVPSVAESPKVVQLEVDPAARRSRTTTSTWARSMHIPLAHSTLAILFYPQDRQLVSPRRGMGMVMVRLRLRLRKVLAVAWIASVVAQAVAWAWRGVDSAWEPVRGQGRELVLTATLTVWVAILGQVVVEVVVGAWAWQGILIMSLKTVIRTQALPLAADQLVAQVSERRVSQTCLQGLERGGARRMKEVMGSLMSLTVTSRTSTVMRMPSRPSSDATPCCVSLSMLR